MPKSLPVLYSFRRCPYAMRARLAIVASGQICALREVVLRNKPAEMLECSPKGTVPVLVLPGGRVVDQSLDIMLWALHRHDPLHWLATTDADQQESLALVQQCDERFKFHLDRYKYPQRYQLAHGTDHRTQGAVFLRVLDSRLAQRGHLVGRNFGLSDAAIAPFVRQFAHTDPAWFASQPWTHLQRWLTAFESSAAFQQAMQPYPAWAPQQPLLEFPPQSASQSL